MLRWEAKVVCGAIMFVAMLVVTLLPIKLTNVFLRQGARGQFILDLLTCFGGGVFMAVYLLFMSPEARLLLEENFMKERNINYPLPEALIGGGFFLVMAVEKLVHHLNRDPAPEDVSISDLGVENNIKKSESQLTLQTTISTVSSATECLEDRPVYITSESTIEVLPAPENPSPSSTRAIIMALALGLDSVLEGMTIGLQRTTSAVWIMFIGVITHEVVIAFSLAVQLMRIHKKAKPVVIVAIIYSLLNPIGVAVGAGVYETMGGVSVIDMVNGILQATTAGCFIYIIFFELLGDQIEEHTHWGKLLAIFAGFGMMAGLAAIPRDGLHCLPTESNGTLADMA